MMVAWRALAGYRWPRERDGQGLIEYALIILLVALVVIVMLAVLGTQLNSVFSNITTSLENATP
jgi:pilus assembly protein Flp/PilA